MDRTTLVLVILISYSNKSYQDETKDKDFTDSIEDLVENILFDDVNKKENATSKPFSRYEVTELVIDVPDDRTVKPIITNYTIKRPLNLVPTTPEPKNCSKEEDGEGKKNTINIFHFKAEFDDKKEKKEEEGSKPQSSVIKEYFRGIKRGIVNGFHSIIHKHKEKNDDMDLDLHDEPVGFFHKIHKSSSNVANKVKHAIFGEKFDDVFDKR